MLAFYIYFVIIYNSSSKNVLFLFFFASHTGVDAFFFFYTFYLDFVLFVLHIMVTLFQPLIFVAQGSVSYGRRIIFLMPN